VRAAGAVVAVAVLVALAGCGGGGGHERRDAVNVYFDHVEAVQKPVRLRSLTISRAFSAFSTVKSSPKETAALVQAHAVLARVAAKLRDMRAPREATRMHRDITRLYELQSRVAGELVQMTRFVPAYAKALTALRPAHAELSKDLKVAKGWRPIAASFKRYRLSLLGVVSKLNALVAPPTFKPSFDAQRRGIRRSIVLCSSIEDALARQDAKATARAINGLSGLAAERAPAKARVAQIAAAKAYNARLRAISALQLRVGTEREKLVEGLG
jgi:hypothetical protein